MAGKKKKNRGFEFKKLTAEGIVEKEGLQLYDWDGRVVATSFPQELEALKLRQNVVKSGVLVGELKRDKLIPSQELALSDLWDRKYWPEMELSYENALCYLMKESFDLSSASRGFHVVTYGGLPLGWINHLGNRFNNLYPNSWRIQRDFRGEPGFSISDHLPEE